MDRPDFQKLVDEYYEPLFRFAMSLAKNQDVASDLTQQTFFMWASKGHQLRDPSKAKSWLFTTLHRAFLGGRRREVKFPHQEFEEVSHELPSVAPSVVNEMDGSTVMDALLELDELYRASLMLFYIEQHAYKEIAEMLEIPIGTVMSRLSRGKAEIRRVLESKASNRADNIISLSNRKNTKRGAQSNG
ncbi:RNA polymerase sigma factor [Verrucomicrobia bacterium]|nr:RNA polymerase sigma factor [Verrucomicrobiota bacterium]